MYFGIAGLLIGASMITKSSYLVIGGGVFAVVTLLDLIYFRQKNFLSLVGIAGISVIVFALWVVFQRQYYGSDSFLENLGLLNQLGNATTGFSISSIAQQAQYLLSFDTHYFYFLWGFLLSYTRLFYAYKKMSMVF